MRESIHVIDQITNALFPLPPLVFYRDSDVHREGDSVLRRPTLLVKGGLIPRPSRVSAGNLSERSRIIPTEYSQIVLQNGREKSGTNAIVVCTMCSESMRFRDCWCRRHLDDV